MKTSTIENLGQVAADTAILAALRYLKANNLTADSGALAECLRSHTKAAMAGAIHDAKEATGCGMHAAASATFRASMSLAGIEAAKECGWPA